VAFFNPGLLPYNDDPKFAVSATFNRASLNNDWREPVAQWLARPTPMREVRAPSGTRIFEFV
jgi:hypothetical protein